MSFTQSNSSSLVADTATETEKRVRRRREDNRKSSLARYPRIDNEVSATAAAVASSNCPMVAPEEHRLRAMNYVDTFVRRCLLPTNKDAALPFSDIVEAYEYWCEQEGVTQRQNTFELRASLTRVLGFTSAAVRLNKDGFRVEHEDDGPQRCLIIPPKGPVTEAFLELHTIGSAVGCNSYRDLNDLEVGRMPVTDDLLYLYYNVRQQDQQGKHNSRLDNLYEPAHVLTINDDDDWDDRVLKGTCVLVRHGSCAVTKLPTSWTTDNWRELAERVRRTAVAKEKETERQQRSRAVPVIRGPVGVGSQAHARLMLSIPTMLRSRLSRDASSLVFGSSEDRV